MTCWKTTPASTPEKTKNKKDLSEACHIENGLIQVDGLELSEEQISLLKNEEKIRSAVSYGEKAFALYSEYLD